MKLVAIDLDGTLLAKDGKISKANNLAIRETQHQGHIVSIASGRSFHDTQHILKNAGLACPLITANGASVFYQEKYLERLMLPGKTTIEVIAMLEENGYYYEIYTNEGIHLFHRLLNEAREEAKTLVEKDVGLTLEPIEEELDIQLRQGGLQHFNHSNETDYNKLDIYKIFVLCFDKEKLAQLERQLQTRQDISLTTSGSFKLEIAHPSVSKGHSLMILADHLQIPLKDTVAIGDNFNDISMFRVAGCSIAMGNAPDKVKEMSTYVTKSSEDDGSLMH